MTTWIYIYTSLHYKLDFGHLFSKGYISFSFLWT